MIGRDWAAQVQDRYGTNDLRVIAAGEGFELKSLRRWRSDYHDITTTGIMFVPRNTTMQQQRTLVAHGLGHHFMHLGNQVWMQARDRVWPAKQERQAEEFAAWLTIPTGEIDDLYLTPADVARRFRVTLELARVRLSE